MDDLEVEGVGETVGEAKWSALRELERRFPGIDKETVRFAVLAEGERGLLGVGYTPARVLASAMPRPEGLEGGESFPPDSPAARLEELLERIAHALGLPAAIAIAETDDALTATLAGPDLGLLIGKRGQTLDAIQYLANAIVYRGSADEETRKQVVVDAAGYQDRRRATLETIADRAASDVLRGGRPVELEPMTAIERKIVHLYLQDREGIVTSSEGTEPNRRVVVLRQA